MSAARALALAGALLAGAAGAADGEALARCAALDDDTARLACYDALAGRPAAGAAASRAQSDFGLVKPQPVEDTRLEARIVGPFREWQAGKRFSLDNGQTWQVIGDSSGYYPGVPDDAEVVITRNLLGGYRMEIKAISRKVKVQRLS
jgi:hypothetical protein